MAAGSYAYLVTTQKCHSDQAILHDQLLLSNQW